MGRWIVALALLASCGNPAPVQQPDASAKRQQVFPVSDLHFRDDQLDAIAEHLTREASARGIQTAAGQTRVEALLSLEATLAAPRFAAGRVNELTSKLASSDVSQWGKLRRKAEHELCGRGKPNERVCGMFSRWNRTRYRAMLSFLSSNYATRWSPWMPTMEWERKFHEFLGGSPADAAAWGWVVLRELRPTVEKQYGRATAENAYRFYLESSGLGTAREARDIFSVPGVALSER